jgi:hypothetical protein
MGMLGLVKNCQGRDDKNRCQEEFAHAGSFGEHRGRILAAWSCSAKTAEVAASLERNPERERATGINPVAPRRQSERAKL